jgi:hypothetical protein
MHTPDWRTALAELCRVSGRLVVLDYPSALSFAALQAFERRALYAVGFRTEPYRVFTDAEIKRALAARGFRVRGSDRHFVLPIALHKAVGSQRFTVAVERALAGVGLLTLFGSPVTLAAERCGSS